MLSDKQFTQVTKVNVDVLTPKTEPFSMWQVEIGEEGHDLWAVEPRKGVSRAELERLQREEERKDHAARVEALAERAEFGVPLFECPLIPETSEEPLDEWEEFFGPEKA